MERAKELMRAEGIRLFWATLPETYLGLYVALPHERPRIYLAKLLRRAPSYLLRSVAWEELAHYFTLREFAATGVWAHPTSRAELSVIEGMALRWAARHILCRGEWEDAQRLCIGSLPELAEFWDVTPELAAYIIDVHATSLGIRWQVHCVTPDPAPGRPGLAPDFL